MSVIIVLPLVLGQPLIPDETELINETTSSNEKTQILELSSKTNKENFDPENYDCWWFNS